ncbi:amidohydrolase [Kineococcus sp. LSe6-4]|uniref:Amidohydrolase n=1 Tax=Kineococcus halophytocola TaxID=3234027 RepID=A0ABV4H0K8_9ACTN
MAESTESRTTPVLPRRGVLLGAAAATAVVAGTAAPAEAAPPHRRPADLVLRGGQVLTLDGAGPETATALAVRDGVVVHVGDDESVAPFTGHCTRVVDLAGRTALPGINDSHLHLLRTGLAMPPRTIDVGAGAGGTVEAAVAAVATAVAAAPAGGWIRGKGWNEDLLGRAPTAADLDAVSSDNPVVLLDWSNHQLWVNSAALAQAGVDASTPVPPGGEVVLDPSGRPTGVLRETAMALVNAHVPPFTRDEQRQAIEDAAAAVVALGITSVTEPGISAVARELYEELSRAGTLPLRVTALLSRPDDTYPVDVAGVHDVLQGNVPARDVDPRSFAVRGVKLRADGVPIASRTAWMHEEYVGGGRGSLVTTGADEAARVAQLAEMVRVVHETGYQIGVHATGDAAIDAVVAAFTAALEAPGDAGSRTNRARHYVIHGDFTSPPTLAVMAEHGIGVNLNPAIRALIADGQPAVVGPERAAYQAPFAAALSAGVPTAASSDSPNVSFDWRAGVVSAVLREGASGQVSGPEQRVGLLQALAAFTTAGAWQDHAEQWKGRLAPGFAGDVCVLAERLLDDEGGPAFPLDQLPQVGIDLVVVGGAVVHDATDPAHHRGPVLSWQRHPHPGGVCAAC